MEMLESIGAVYIYIYTHTRQFNRRKKPSIFLCSICDICGR